MSRGIIDQALSYIGDNLRTIPAAQMTGHTSTNLSATSGTWYALNNFSGASRSHIYTDTDYIAYDQNGFRILKAGIYKLTLVAHVNNAATGNFIGTRFYNYTTSTPTGIVTYGYAAGTGWVHLANTTITSIGANQIILPQFERYSGSANFRPQDFVFTAELLKET